MTNLIQTLGMALGLPPNREAATAGRGALGQVDLGFVVDTTGSMSPFLTAARRNLVSVMRAVSEAATIDLRAGIVAFRDHPPQDTSYVTKTVALTHDLKVIEKAIDGLEASGGGDAPEAVYDGVHVACSTLAWRPNSVRIAVLVGDAPPHGFRRNAATGPASSCTCGLSLDATTAIAEAKRVAVHALSIGGASDTTEAFAQITNATGGRCEPGRNGDRVIQAIAGMLEAEFKDIEFDGYVLDAVQSMGEIDTAAAATMIGSNRLSVAASIARLGRRGLFAG